MQSTHCSACLLTTIVALAGLALPRVAVAQTTPQTDAAALRQDIDQLRKEFDTLKDQYGTRLADLEAKLATISGAAATAQTTPVAPVAQVPAAPLTDPGLAPPGLQTTPSAASNVFNPSTSVIGNFLGAAGRNTVNPAPALAMRESEVSFQAVVDPYARADFFLGFGEEGVELEEGFITFPTLPGGLLMKVGKTKSQFGKVNTLHAHVLPWVDRPLVLENLVGGEEGLADSGISVARLIPNPWMFLEATGQVNRGDSGEVFQASKRGDLSYVGHLRAYRDVSESSNIDLGASYARGHNASGFSFIAGADAGRFTTSLYGVDATFRWKPLRRSIYNSFLARSELVWSRREQPDGLQKAFGYYVSGDYQFARRWFGGARYDRSNHADEASLLDSGQSLILTYKPTEFSLVRGQYRRTRFAIGEDANEFLFQFLFAIGAHGAHPF
jgi:hypothetical protein